MSCSTESGSTRSSKKNRGQIQIILGPMFAGTTTELCRRIMKYEYTDRECVLIKYVKDTKYSDNCVSRHEKLKISAIKTEVLKDVDIPSNCSVIGIDEGQFFPDIVDFCEKKANDGKIVIVAALDGIFQQEAFGSILSLIPLSESVVKLTAVCMTCFGEAAFTKRIGKEPELEITDRSESYKAVCRKCYLENKS